MLADSEEIHCCSLLAIEGILTQFRRPRSGEQHVQSQTQFDRWQQSTSQGSTPGEALADAGGSGCRSSGRPCVRDADAFAVRLGWLVDFRPLTPMWSLPTANRESRDCRDLA